jgi:transposase InsO family protein
MASKTETPSLKKRHVHHSSRKKQKNQGADSDGQKPQQQQHRFPKIRERRKFAQVYLTRDDVQATIAHVLAYKDKNAQRVAQGKEAKRLRAPPKYAGGATKKEKKQGGSEAAAAAADGKRHKLYGRLLWRRRPIYSLHLQEEPVLVFRRDGKVEPESQLTEMEREAIVKHVTLGTVPSEDTPEFKYWAKPGVWRIEVHSRDSLVISRRGVRLTPAQVGMADVEKENIIAHLKLRNKQSPPSDMPGRRFFDTERTFEQIDVHTDEKTGRHSLVVKDAGLGPNDPWRTVVPAEDVDATITKAFDDPVMRTGPERLFKRMNETCLGVPRRAVQKFLKKQITYQLHQPLRNPRTIHHVITTSRPYERWQADLVDVQAIQYDNDKYRYILTMVDLFSKRGFARALLDKTAVTVADAFEDIVATETGGRMPDILQTDNGSEFISDEFNKRLDALWTNDLNKMGATYERTDRDGKLKSVGRHVYSAAYKPTTQGAVERFNRTLKNMMYSNITEKQGLYVADGKVRSARKEWVKDLPGFIRNYNDNYSYSTGFKPNELHFQPTQVAAMPADQQAEIARRWKLARAKIDKRRDRMLAKRRRLSNKYVHLDVGDVVRVSRMTFAKYRREESYRRGYLRNWSEAVFVVAKIKYAEGMGKDQEWAYYWLYLLDDPSNELDNEKSKDWELVTVPRRLIAKKRERRSKDATVQADLEREVQVKAWRRRLYREDLQKLTTGAYEQFEEQVAKRRADIKAQQEAEARQAEELAETRRKAREEAKKQKQAVPEFPERVLPPRKGRGVSVAGIESVASQADVARVARPKPKPDGGQPVAPAPAPAPVVAQPLPAPAPPAPVPVPAPPAPPALVPPPLRRSARNRQLSSDAVGAVANKIAAEERKKGKQQQQQQQKKKSTQAAMIAPAPDHSIHIRDFLKRYARG